MSASYFYLASYSNCKWSKLLCLLTFQAPTPQKVKHTQTICRQLGHELFECVWPFSGVGS